MGKESAPWIYNGRSEALCKMHIVEKKDWCNRKNNDVLENAEFPTESQQPFAKLC